MSLPDGYIAGTWTIDGTHSDVSFWARHLMVSKVRGHFKEFSGTITTAENPADSKVEAVIKTASIDTNQEQRDGHLKSPDFLDVENHPEITFTSTSVAGSGDAWKVTGDLSVRGTVKPVVLDVELNGFGPDPYGGTRAGFTATTSINRQDFGVNFNAALETGGLVVSDTINITLEIEATLNA